MQDVPNPETADRTKLLTIARIKLEESGATNYKIDADKVSKVRTYVKRRVGSPITHQKLVDFEKGILPGYENRSKTMLKSKAKKLNKVKESVSKKVISGLTDFIELLKHTKAFVKQAGSVDVAIELLRLLED